MRNIYYFPLLEIFIFVFVRIWFPVRKWEYILQFYFSLMCQFQSMIQLNLSYLPLNLNLLLYSHYSGSCFSVCPASEVQLYIPNSLKNRNNHLSNDFVSDICFKSIRIVSGRANKRWIYNSFLFSLFSNYLYAWAGLPGSASLLKPLKYYLIFKYCFRSSMTLTWTWAF